MKPSQMNPSSLGTAGSAETSRHRDGGAPCPLRALSLLLVAAFCAQSILAQQSPNFKIKASDLNAGGTPKDGIAITSTNFTLTVDSLGDCLAITEAKSAHFRVRAGFPARIVEAVIPGDCDGDGTVSIGEVQKAINMFLGTLAPDCGVDCNGDGTVSIGEVQKGINGFLGLPSSC